MAIHRSRSHRRSLQTDAAATAKALFASGLKLVLAESCTGGLVAASLAAIPGISDHLCGSAVVYRNNTKRRWLGVPGAMLEDPGAVSADVAAAMVRGALSRTPEADLAAAITGYLGPNSPPGQDGLVYIAVGLRPTTAAWKQGARQEAKSKKQRSVRIRIRKAIILPWLKRTTQRITITSRAAETRRFKRQVAASQSVLFMVRSLLNAAKNLRERD